MPRLTTVDIETVHQLGAELCTVQLDAPVPLEQTLAKVRAFVGLDSMLVFEPVERLSGFGLARFESDNLPNANRFAKRLADVLSRAPARFWCFDPVAPEAHQRDRVVETIDEVGERAYRECFVYRELLAPERLGGYREVRALVCSGGTLVGWVGGFHEGALEADHRTRLTALLPAFRRRLVHDRLVRALDTSVATAVLDYLAEAAFVIGQDGELAYVNRLGRARLAADPEGTLALLTTPSEVTERHRLDSGHLLVIARDGTEPDFNVRIERAATRWRLTPRQREVLHWLVRGRGNASIARELEISERAVEQHITAILDRAKANSRASLIALVLGSLVLTAFAS